MEEQKKAASMKKEPHKDSRIGKVIGVVSGKGGVGKSLVTSLLAVEMKKRGYRVGILDADITGPSIPKAFGVRGPLLSSADGRVFPKESQEGIRIVSINLMLEREEDPVLWRAPLVSGTVNQFWQEVVWQDIDYLLVDMPPGTGDVSLTVFQSIHPDGIVVVTSPQELVSMIVSKAVKMAEMMAIPILGLVENLSYFRCPDNGKDYQIFGDSHLGEIASKEKLAVLGRIPVDPRLAALVDSGQIEEVEGAYLKEAGDLLEALQKESR